MRRFWNPYRSPTIISNYGGNVNKNYKIFIISDIIQKGYGLLIFSIGDFKRPFFFCGQEGKAWQQKRKLKQ